MRIAHISDVHLGYRAYARLTPEGVNQREDDVFGAFERVLVDVTGRNVDLIVIAGDMFHTVRPSNLVIQKTFRLFSRFRRKYDTPIVIVGGNHDTPKSTDAGCILDLFPDAFEHVYVRHHGYEGLGFDGLGCRVYCLPYFALHERNTQVRPAEGGGVNVLALHGTVRGVAYGMHDPVQLDPGELYFDEWNYIAVGHYHIRTEIAPNCFYSGATEYTSTNIWEEARGPSKGYLIYDSEGPEVEVHGTPGLREVHDLAPLAAEDLCGEEIMGAIETQLAGLNGLQDRIVRVVVDGIPRSIQRDLDWGRLRELKSQAMHLELALRPPARAGQAAADGVAGSSRPLEVEWREFAEALEGLPRGIDPKRLSALGSQYLAKAAEEEAKL
jgi:DNA repair exonuclease SbcCD nuclease subunit